MIHRVLRTTKGVSHLMCFLIGCATFFLICKCPKYGMLQGEEKQDFSGKARLNAQSHNQRHLKENNKRSLEDLKTPQPMRRKQHPLHNDTEHIMITERDLMSRTAAKINIDRYRKLLQWKLSELQKNGVSKSHLEKTPCDWKSPGGACVDGTCREELPEPMSDENLASVLKPLYRMKHNALDKVKAALGSIPRGSRVTFLTAVSSNHFLESQALIKNLHKVVFPKMSNFTFYFYDIGLTKKERLQLERFCKCNVVKYPLEKLPKRFGFLRGFTWKPIIINAHLPHTEFVVWLDSSIRFRTSNLEPMFAEAKSRGLILGSVAKFNAAEHTSKAMFDYYGNKACQFSQYQQGEAGFQVIHNDQFMSEFFLKVWTGCAIDPGCMCTQYDVKQFGCDQSIRKYSKCHRTDQSAHALILSKLFREKIESFYVPKGKYHIVRRHEQSNYFETLEKNSRKLRT